MRMQLFECVRYVSISAIIRVPLIIYYYIYYTLPCLSCRIGLVVYCEKKIWHVIAYLPLYRWFITGTRYWFLQVCAKYGLYMLYTHLYYYIVDSLSFVYYMLLLPCTRIRRPRDVLICVRAVGHQFHRTQAVLRLQIK